MPILRSILVAAALMGGSFLVPGCVAPPRDPAAIKPIPPRPLTPMSLPPIQDAPPADFGGSAGVFTGPEPMAPAAPGAAVGGSYTVVRGDTLSGIARRTYGNPSAWKRIAAANPGVDPNRLAVGQVLMLP